MYEKYNVYLKSFKKDKNSFDKKEQYIKYLINKEEFTLEDLEEIIFHAKEELDSQYNFSYSFEIDKEHFSDNSKAVYSYNIMTKEHKIVMNMLNILSDKKDKTPLEMIESSLQSFYHEYRHMMLTHITLNKNNYGLDLFQIILDRLIFDLSREVNKKRRGINNIKYNIENLEPINYYEDIYDEHFEERKSKIFGLEKTIEFLETRNIQDNNIKYLKLELGKEISNDENNHFYSEKKKKNRLEYGLDLLKNKVPAITKYLGQYPIFYSQYLSSQMKLHDLIIKKYEILSDLLDVYEEDKNKDPISSKISFEQRKKDLEELFDNLYLIEYKKDYCKKPEYLGRLREEIVPSLERIHKQKKTQKVKNEIDFYNYKIPNETFNLNKKLLEEDYKNFLKLEKETIGYIKLSDILEKQTKIKINL